MYNRSEGFFKGHDDTNLFFQIWDNPQAKGTVIFTHGQGEHSECYHRLTTAFDGGAWSFYGWDLRGHGRSEGRRGYVSSFDDYVKDYKIFLERIIKSEKLRKGPIVLLGHSMGGLTQIKAMIRNPDIPCTAAIFSAPLLGLTVPVPVYKSKGALFLNTILPKVTMGNEITNDMLTRDPDVIREYEQDALRTDRISTGAFLGFLDSFEFVRPRVNDIKKPALVLVSDHDPIVSTEEVKTFFDKLGTQQKELFIYPGSKHELFNDINRATVFADVKKFLDSFLEQK